jgi:hypothetical protein
MMMQASTAGVYEAIVQSSKSKVKTNCHGLRWQGEAATALSNGAFPPKRRRAPLAAAV